MVRGFESYRLRYAGVLKFGRRGLIANQLGRNGTSVRITSPALCVCRQALKVVKKIEPVRWNTQRTNSSNKVVKSIKDACD